jgi:hypothetical protein
MLRASILACSLLPYLYYGYLDNVFHFRGRKVSLPEHLLHLAIGVMVATAIVNAFTGQLTVMLVGLVLFMVAGAVDEYIFHRGLPEPESDLHAKEHLGLMIFVVAAMVTQWLDSHGWQLAPLLDELSGARS